MPIQAASQEAHTDGQAADVPEGGLSFHLVALCSLLSFYLYVLRCRTFPDALFSVPPPTLLLG